MTQGSRRAPWTLTRKLIVVFVVSSALGLTTGAFVLRNLHALAKRIDRLADVRSTSSRALMQIHSSLGDEHAALLGLVATRDMRFHAAMQRARTSCRNALDLLGREQDALQTQEIAALRGSRAAEAEIADEIVAAADRPRSELEPLARAYTSRRDAVVDRLGRISDHQERMLAAARAEMASAAGQALWWMLAGFGVCGAWATVLAVALHRTVRSIRRGQADLRDYMDRIETTNRELDAFAGRIAHDLRNVMSPISMLPALLRMRAARHSDDAAAALDSSADVIERAGTAATRVLEGLLAFSRAGTVADDDITPSITGVIEEVSHELEPLRQRVGATLEHDVIDVAVRCSPGLLHVLVMNLLSNAYKFLEGCPRREVRMTARECDHDWCEIVVEDTGPGIPVEHRRQIFEPFYRVPGALAGGHGIGLATVRRIVDACGGDITLESKPGAGTTFRVRMCLATAAHVSRPPPTTGRPAAPEL